MKTFLIECDVAGILMVDLHGQVAASLRQVARMPIRRLLTAIALAQE